MNNRITLEQKLSRADFHAEFADDAKIFNSVLAKAEEKRKPASIRFFKRPVFIAAALITVIVMSGLTAFAGEIVQYVRGVLLESTAIDGVTLDRYDELTRGGSNIESLVYFNFSEDAQPQFSLTGDDKRETIYADSAAEASDIAGFRLFEPVLPDESLTLRPVELISTNGCIHPSVDLFYKNGKQYVLLMQTRIGEGGSLEINSKAEFETKNIGGIDVILQYPMEDTFVLNWKQGELGISLRVFGYPLDDALEVAKSIIEPEDSAE